MNNTTEATLSERELATVLAALRVWQANPVPPASVAAHFEEYSPLSAAEIDELCERLNCAPTSTSSQTNHPFKEPL